MSFDWTEKSKEKYFRKARKIVREAGYKDILQVDKKQFGIAPGKVKVFFQPVDRFRSAERWKQAKEDIFGLKEHSQRNISWISRKEKTLYIHPYIEMDMDRKDAK